MPKPSRMKLHNVPEVEGLRKYLRRNLTPAEAALWKILKNAKFAGRKFRRQHSVGNYVLDFYCPAERLAIELDGEVHYDELAYVHDRKRSRYLRSQGIKIIRFENEVVFQDAIFLLHRIESAFGWWKEDEKQRGRSKKLPSWTGGVAAASADGVVDRQLYPEAS